jgi:hypothetical protein
MHILGSSYVSTTIHKLSKPSMYSCYTCKTSAHSTCVTKSFALSFVGKSSQNLFLAAGTQLSNLIMPSFLKMVFLADRLFDQEKLNGYILPSEMQSQFLALV